MGRELLFDEKFINKVIKGFSNKNEISKTIRLLESNGIKPKDLTIALRVKREKLSYFGTKLNPQNPLKIVNSYNRVDSTGLLMMSIVIILSLIFIIVINRTFINAYKNRFDETDPEETSKSIINGFYVANVALLLATVATYLSWMFCCSKTIDQSVMVSIFTLVLIIGYIVVLAMIPKTYFEVSDAQ